jgi:hypothetical protein
VEPSIQQREAPHSCCGAFFLVCRHWAASDVNDFETEDRTYHEDAVLEYPQSGERIRGPRNIQITPLYPAEQEALYC